MGVDSGYELEGEGECGLESLGKVKCVISNCKVGVGGGIKGDRIKDIVGENGDLIIVGGGIGNGDEGVEGGKECRGGIEGK